MQLWNALGAEDRVPGQLSAMAPAFGSEQAGLLERLTVMWGFVRSNIFSLVGAWNHYLSLSHESRYFFWFSFTLFGLCNVSLALRILQLKLDAIYIGFYFSISLMDIWIAMDKRTASFRSTRS